MSKNADYPLPLLDYLRIHRVIRSVLDSAGANTAHACWYFSMAGAAILRHHYRKDAQPIAGAMCLMTNEQDSNVMCFAKIEGDVIYSSNDAFHALVAYGDHLIDFMSPIFTDTAKSSERAFVPPSRSFQRRIDSMKSSHTKLRVDGDFFFLPNPELTGRLLRKVSENRFQTDVVRGCVDWYRKPPKAIPPSIKVGDEKGQMSTVRLKGGAVVGAW